MESEGTELLDVYGMLISLLIASGLNMNRSIKGDEELRSRLPVQVHRDR